MILLSLEEVFHNVERLRVCLGTNNGSQVSVRKSSRVVEGSKEGFKDGGRVHGKGLRKGPRTLEESTGWWKNPWSVNTSLKPSLVENILRQWSKEGLKDGGRVHG
ncbi:hypothetical protein KY289_008460 [Solanum tuberosum]|nr:hypothetical protein KY289_008460 [Solanum tuberosum]